MDVYHFKLHFVNDIIYFIKSSYEYPYVMSLIRGRVNHVHSDKYKIFYHVQPLEFTDTIEHINQYINDGTFRFIDTINKRVTDRKIHIDAKQPITSYIIAYPYLLFDIAAPLAFSNLQDAIDARKIMHLRTIDMLQSTINTLRLIN
jgi:hypothetical protein